MEVHPILLAGSFHSNNKIQAEKVRLVINPTIYRNFEYRMRMEITIEDVASIFYEFTSQRTIYGPTYGPFSQEQDVFDESVNVQTLLKETGTGSPPESTKDSEVLSAKNEVNDIVASLELRRKYQKDYYYSDDGLCLTRVHRMIPYDYSPRSVGSLYDLVFSAVPVAQGDIWTIDFPRVNQLAPRSVDFTLQNLNKKVAKITARIRPCPEYEVVEPNEYWIETETGTCLVAKGRTKVHLGKRTYTFGFEEKLVKQRPLLPSDRYNRRYFIWH